jgi:hypothetical protein
MAGRQGRSVSTQLFKFRIGNFRITPRIDLEKAQGTNVDMMNAALSNLFEKFQSRESAIRVPALAELSIFLEWVIQRPGRDEERCERILSKELLALHPSEHEIEDVLDRAVSLFDTSKLSESEKNSLFRIIMHYADVRHGDFLFEHLSRSITKFDEQEIFSSLAELALFLQRVGKEKDNVKRLLAKYGIFLLLWGLESNPSARIRENVQRLNNYLKAQEFDQPVR